MTKHELKMWISGYFAALEGVVMSKELIEKTQRLLIEKVSQSIDDVTTDRQKGSDLLKDLLDKLPKDVPPSKLNPFAPIPRFPDPISPNHPYPYPWPQNPYPQYPGTMPTFPGVLPTIVCGPAFGLDSNIKTGGCDATNNSTSNPTKHTIFFTGNDNE